MHQGAPLGVLSVHRPAGSGDAHTEANAYAGTVAGTVNTHRLRYKCPRRHAAIFQLFRSLMLMSNLPSMPGWRVVTTIVCGPSNGSS